jgi:Zn-finger nucleic acid-binding protein
MRCPLCNVKMREVPRRGVKIDVCPECRGVWLDAGEMEKMLEGAERWEEEDWEDRDRDRDKRNYDRDYEHHPYGRKKRKSFMDDLFDFG